MDNSRPCTHLTVCSMCDAHCGLKIFINGSEIEKIEGQKENPYSKGYICPKGKAAGELLSSPERLKHPLMKTASNNWREISWDEALCLTAQKLKEIAGKYGAKAVAFHTGHPGVKGESFLYAERLCRIFGTPNFSTAGSHCHYSKLMAGKITLGALPVPDFCRSNCIVLWGHNPVSSCPPLMHLITEARRRGARLIVIDPKATPLAKKAELHLQLRPGTDAALALGFIHVIIKEQLYDRIFVKRWTTGFEHLAEHVEEYTPERVQSITWVPAVKIREAAHLYAAFSPACISTGIAVELSSNGFEALRAICILQAVTGNLDVPGGAIFVPDPKLASLKTGTCLPEKSLEPAVGRAEFPLFYKYSGQAQANFYSRAILEGKPYFIKAMVIAGSNPALTWPNHRTTKSALERLEFLAVADHFMTETAELADIVIPAAVFLEKCEIWKNAGVYGTPVIGLAPALAKGEGSRSDWDLWVELAWKMGYKEYFPWSCERDAINFRLKPLGLNYEDLKALPFGYVYEQWTPKKYERTGFKTPSGKVEIYSKELAKYGYNPLPVFCDPLESWGAASSSETSYPLILTTGARTISYLHSRFRNITSTRRLTPEPLLEVHPKTAAELKIAEGEKVTVKTPWGSVEIKAKLTGDIHPLVIFMPHGWGEANANVLSSEEFADPVTGFPSARCLPARITKIV